jgi:hypothetical protein
MTLINQGGQARQIVLNQFYQISRIYGGGYALSWLMYGSMPYPIYGWIHSPQAEANRNAMQQAANTAAQMRDAVRQQGQPQMGNNQGQIALLQQRIATLQQELQVLRQQQTAGGSP